MKSVEIYKYNTLVYKLQNCQVSSQNSYQKEKYECFSLCQENT